MKRSRWLVIGFILLGAALVIFPLIWNYSVLHGGDATAVLKSPAAIVTSVPPTATARPEKFRGEQALKDVEYQLGLGARTPGSEAHRTVIAWIQKEAQSAGWRVDLQNTEMMGHTVTNIIAKRGTGQPWLLIGAHYDSRLKADQDPDPQKRELTVPAANDGAAGVAVLLELARSLPEDLPGEVWLVFFDAEDQGNLPGWDWILGSQAVADSLAGKPDAVVVIDMIGDADLNIYQERNSDPELTDEIWKQASKAGYSEQFIPQLRHAMLDDHTPFIRKGIKAIDIIDFDYPYWHTSEDTLDKVSAESMEAVGETLRQWLVQKK